VVAAIVFFAGSFVQSFRDGGFVREHTLSGKNERKKLGKMGEK
jgi:hypothetical protein